VVLAISSQPLQALGAVIHVPADQATIQGAIDAASDADEIIVSPGTYVENINFNGKNIVLRSTDPTSPTVVANTIIDGNWDDTVVSFSGTETQTCVLSGFTITHGLAPNGAGIHGNGTRATVENNRIRCNQANGADDAGDGAGLHKCDGLIRNNSISLNLAHGIVNFVIGTPHSFYSYYYSTYGDGGGLYDCDGTILNNMIFANMSDNGGGLYGCDGTILNNTIFHNQASGYWYVEYCIENPYLQCTEYQSGYEGSGGGLAMCSATIKNCIIWQNKAYSGDGYFGPVAASYCCVQGGAPGTGNISCDPQFVNPVYGDLHLKSKSPCIDAGCYIDGLNYDFEGNPRPIDVVAEPRGDGCHFDIGADEFMRTYVKSNSWLFY
jgi:hypothetical protein